MKMQNFVQIAVIIQNNEAHNSNCETLLRYSRTILGN